MEAWYGVMDWPLNTKWRCEVCGQVSLLWGICHGTCRCTVCHTQYRMRDEKDKVVKVPICQLKTKYYNAVKKLYQELKTPLTQWTSSQWDNAMKEVK